ncbi:inward rectifier potassium channel 2-like isoform X1 [Leptopilina boulardi]|uniref:inward rectifier potassium channel 2-like isoform X1 n=1 Tax=Leptopilina boulardi TaxID=63433 RepID=UPI0021F629C0|nr:inward rectifier potassium channel 2-like isoform X1 [Leptopilina boulardi]
MPISQKRSSSSINKKINEDEVHEKSPSPWNELLANSTVPATAVAVKLCEDSPDETIKDSNDKNKLGVFNSFQRRTFSRLSFKGEGGPLLAKYKHAKFSSKRLRKRVVFKHGDCNVVQGNVAKRRRRYLQDIFTTLVDAQWRWTLLVFSMNFLLSWLGFALVWWLIVYTHGDLDPKNYNNPNISFTPCVVDIHGFTSCFLFSVETQHTIGYGSKHTTEECPEAIFIMCIQSMTGVILQAFMVGIVFAKLSRPKKRTQTLLFSRNAVICQRDGQPCLMFRVGDMRKSHIIEAHVRAQMIRKKVTREGETLPFFQTELKVGGDGEEDKIFFIWPTTIVHKIDENSPLYRLSASDMLHERFEIVVMLEGVIESTGMTTQARSSYLPSEILWGHRFENIIHFRKETGEYEVNYTLFNNTYEVDTPLCSALQLDQVRALHHAKGEHVSTGTFPAYRDNSSSSLTSASGSSLASSTGGLHMHAPTPPTPIPVMITGPDDSPSRRESINNPNDQKLATFYTHDETPEPVNFGRNSSYISKNQTEQGEENYDKVLEDINSSLRKNRRPSLHGKEEKKIQREGSRATLEAVKIDSHHENLKNSSSNSTLELKQIKYSDSPERIHEPSISHHLPRRSSLSEKNKNKQDLQKRTTFVLQEEDPSSSAEHRKKENALRISPPPPPRIPPRPEIVIDVRENIHHTQFNSPQEQV